MHTYIKGEVNNKNPWVVVFETEDGQRSVRAFKHEIQALAFTNYLNGGTQDIVLIKELVEQK